MEEDITLFDDIDRSAGIDAIHLLLYSMYLAKTEEQQCSETKCSFSMSWRCGIDATMQSAPEDGRAWTAYVATSIELRRIVTYVLEKASACSFKVVAEKKIEQIGIH